MSHPIRNVILGRWKYDAPRLAPVRKALDFALDAHDALRDFHSAVSANTLLSPLGRLDEMRGFISKRAAPAIHRGRETAASLRADLAKWRTRLQPAPPDPKNVAEAVMRSSMLTMLRGMSQGARTALLLSKNPDPRLVQAVREAPEFLSRVSAEIKERMVQMIVARDHPTDLAAIAEADEALALLDAATETVFTAARSVAEFPSDKMFADFVETTKPARPTASLDEPKSPELIAFEKLAKEAGIKSMNPDGSIEYHPRDTPPIVPAS
jgi:hypothetical protein